RRPDHRRKKTAHAPIVDRKAHPGQVQHRRIFYAQRNVARGAAAFLSVEFDRGTGHLPGVVARLAAREYAVVDRYYTIGVGVNDDTRRAARGGFVQYVRSVLNFAGAGIAVDE